MKHIGILAHSFEGAALCYREICLKSALQLGEHRHPEITLTGVAIGAMLNDWDIADYRGIRETFLRGARKLEGAGADFFVCPCNTGHIALESGGEPFPIPCLHIAEVVARQAKIDGRRKVGVLGTEWIMASSVYPKALRRHGIDWEIPNAQDRSIVHNIIFDELCVGVIRDESRRSCLEIIEKLGTDGCDAVALVCTEIPLLVSEETSPLPMLDSTRLLARDAVAVAIGETAPPTWHGGSA